MLFYVNASFSLILFNCRPTKVQDTSGKTWLNVMNSAIIEALFRLNFFLIIISCHMQKILNKNQTITNQMLYEYNNSKYNNNRYSFSVT